MIRLSLVCGLLWRLATPAHAAAPDGLDALPLDVRGLDAAHRQTLRELTDKYPSPCGKAHSLYTSLRSDPQCRRSPYAFKFLQMLLRLELPRAEIEDHYEERFVSPGRGECKPGGPVRGDPSARVEICEYSDFQCPHCKKAEPMLNKLLDNYKGKIKLVFKNYPIVSLHPRARAAAAAAVAAGQQGKFWEMHDLLFDRQEQLGDSDLEKYASKLKLQLVKWKSDLPAAGARVDRDRAEGEAIHITHTPSIYLNGREYHGPLQYDYLADWIDEELAR